MNRTEVKGLAFGFLFGLFLLWWNWPEGQQIADLDIARTGGYIIGVMFVVWFTARLIRKGERGPKA